ncbi:transcriptional regulator [Betaproteobacteria bacterium GR16-43]|nr:transcriptional regulator [Betaproteobacteria bacterium GR16-43]
MYTPKHFDEPRIDVLHALIRERPLSTLVTLTARGLEANHIPLLLDAQPGPFGTLRGHVARGNPLWKDFNAGIDVLAVFTGPEAYITPSWYPGKKVDGKVVPTWNYAVAHAKGTLHVHDDAAWLRAHLEQLVDFNEGRLPKPWKVGDAPEDFVAKMIGAIVGIEIPLRSLTGKWKMSQNRSDVDRNSVAAGLRVQGGDEKEQVAALVEPKAAS